MVWLIVLEVGLMAIDVHASQLQNSYSPNDADRQGLVGKVRVVKRESASLRQEGDALIEGSLVTESIAVYDDRGNEVESSFPKFGIYNRRTCLKYDSNNRLLERNLCGLEDTVQTFYVYNVSGKLIEEIYKPSLGQTGRKHYSYKEDGDLVKISEYDKQGTPISQIVLSKDGNGQTIKRRSVFGAPDSGFYIMKYDQKGNLIESTSYQQAGMPVVQSIYTYDSKGNTIREVTYSPSQPNGFGKGFMYQYDAMGNWIKRTTKEFDGKQPEEKPSSVEYRSITYY
jgi:hypothetical protein